MGHKGRKNTSTKQEGGTTGREKDPKEKCLRFQNHTESALDL